MAPPHELIEVFKCLCGRFIPCAEGLHTHLQVCLKLQEKVALNSAVNNSRPTKLSEHLVKNGVMVVQFYSPRVSLKTLSDSEVKTARSEFQGKADRNQNYNNDDDDTMGKTRRSRRNKSLIQKESDYIYDNEDGEGEFTVESSDGSKDDFDEFQETKHGGAGGTKRKRKRQVAARSREPRTIADDLYIHKCNKCPTKFKSQKDFEWHMFNIHGDGSKKFEIIPCALCGRMLNKRLVYHSHLKSHENAEALEEAFDLWNKWPKRKASMTMKFNCKYCLIPHTSHHSFLTHMKVQHPEKGRFCKYSCQYCRTSEFDSMKHFIIHLRTAHLEEYYGKTIKWGLSDPLKQSGRPKGQCDICKKMLDVFYIRAHKEKVHYSQDQKELDNQVESDNCFRCPMSGCHSKFKNRCLLKNHFMLHLQNNPFKCQFPGCRVQCDAQCHLDRHMKLHTSKLIPCPKCGVHYSRIDKLKTHVCCFDSTKLKYDENGQLRHINSMNRLEKFHPNKTDQRHDEGPAKSCTDDENGTDADADNNSFDNANEKSTTSKRYKKRNININAIIASDPVFVQVCKDNPGFRELIIGRKLRSDKPHHRKKPYHNHRQETECSKCGQILVNSASLARHWDLIHGVKLKPLSVVTHKKSINRANKTRRLRDDNSTTSIKETPNHMYRTRFSKRSENISISRNKTLDYSIVKVETEPEMSIDNCDIDIKSEVTEEYVVKEENE